MLCILQKAMTPRSEYDVIVSPLRDQYTLKGNSCKVKLFTFSIDQRHMTALWLQPFFFFTFSLYTRTVTQYDIIKLLLHKLSKCFCLLHKLCLKKNLSSLAFSDLCNTETTWLKLVPPSSCWFRCMFHLPGNLTGLGFGKSLSSCLIILKFPTNWHLFVTHLVVAASTAASLRVPSMELFTFHSIFFFN